LSTERKYSDGRARPSPADPLVIILVVFIGLVAGAALLYALAWLFLDMALSGGGGVD
jgi:hypothetical protein